MNIFKWQNTCIKFHFYVENLHLDLVWVSNNSNQTKITYMNDFSKASCISLILTLIVATNYSELPYDICEYQNEKI